MITAVLDGKKVEVLPTDDDILSFEFSKQLAVDNGNGVFGITTMCLFFNIIMNWLISSMKATNTINN